MLDPQSPLPVLPPARQITVAGYAISYFVTGPDDGQPLVLCHGLGASGLQFVEDAAFFAARGYRVIVPDLRGHGRSTSPRVRTDEDFSIRRMAADLIAILDAEEVEATDWVGNSLGGILALSLVNTNRERLKRLASFGMVLSVRLPAALVMLIKLIYKIVGSERLARLSARSTSQHKDTQAMIYAMLSKMDMNAMARVVGHVSRYDFTPQARQFGEPMLMICGAQDNQVNRTLKPTRELMEGHDNFRLIELDDTGHCANLDQPEIVRNLISDFLQTEIPVTPV